MIEKHNDYDSTGNLSTWEPMITKPKEVMANDWDLDTAFDHISNKIRQGKASLRLHPKA